MKIVRIRDTGVQTLSILTLEGRDFFLIEPSWVHNIQYISCIPIGMYRVVLRTSDRYKEHLHIQDVPGRSLILIHIGNFRRNTTGCILPGVRFQYNDDHRCFDTVESGNAMNDILSLFGTEARLLEIAEHQHFQRFYTEKI